jgi:hypothetical protein
VNRESISVRPHSAFTRVLSLLLLTFVVYGTTVEAAHTHSSLADTSTVAGVSSFSDPATESMINTTLAGCGDCLICQLHQHFSATLISVPLNQSQSSHKSGFFELSAVSINSQTTATQTGRAPPQATL